MSEKYEKIWSKWDKAELEKQIEFHREGRRKYLGLVEKHLKKTPGLKALEVGCGSSIDSHLIAEETTADLYGVDISEEALRVAREVSLKFDKKVNLSVGDALKLEFDPNTFDLVFSQGLLEHFDKPLEVLKEQIRILKPGGILIVNVPQKYTVYTIYKHLSALFGRWEWGAETEFSSWQLKWLGNHLGLEFLEKHGYDYWRSPFEVSFVLKTLDDKIAKIPFVKESPAHKEASGFWKKMWADFEDHYGYLFMKNIIYVYKKPETKK
ncbi:MAG: methyltransferase domain-containing protein [Candidatus Omnitrophota bacterium]